MLDLSQLAVVLQKVFAGRTYGQDLENYILSKDPKTANDIELFTQQYQRDRERSMLWL